MEQLSPAATDATKKILAGKGQKLHTHEVHLRRTDNKGYVARHDLRDKHGRPPADGQRGEKEYSLADKTAMLQHINQHMGEMEPEEQGEQGEQDEEGE